ncbi:hypothetical protein GCM10009744_36710 [Kribbella alba]|uniref:site-specific DNA-methyltransferase (adenine-specific) n=1 Tax=Kribbella alba TaxID=190197 RepID=A0ABN2FEE8_9ACTN
MSAAYRRGRQAPDSAQEHRNWLALVEVSGPFLSLPVLRKTWPSLDALDGKQRERLRLEHARWQEIVAPGDAQSEVAEQGWIDYVLRELLGWADDLHTSQLEAFRVEVGEHDALLVPSFVLSGSGEEPRPDSARLLGLVVDPAQHPTARVAESEWSATPVDRMAMLCRRHGVELGLVTNGRWWALVYAPKGKATGSAVFDAVAWQEAAERDVVRAFRSLLNRERFFGVPDDESLTALFQASEAAGEEITERLGVQVRQAVELLVAAMGRSDLQARERDEPGLTGVAAHDVYRGAVSVMMRIVFLLFAEERKLLPSDNELYATSYSAGRLCAELEERALQGTEEELENTHGAWHRLLALFAAVYSGFEHPRLVMHGHDGSLFNPDEYPWMPHTIDDRTVLHMLRAVQYVEIGSGRSKERRALSFRSLDVEQIGYVYEGLLSFDAYHADDVVVGLIGKEGLEDEVLLRDLESLASGHADVPALASALADKYKDSKVGSTAALQKRLTPLTGLEREEARKRLLAVTRGNYPLAERLLPFAELIRADLRGLPIVVLSGGLYITESSLRKTTGTHYTPRSLAEQVVDGALEPLVYSPGPLETSDKKLWKPKSSDEILSLKVADIAMGSAAFLVAAARYLGKHLVEAWSREGDSRAGECLARERDIDAEDDPLVIEARRQIIEHCLYGTDINPMAVEMAKLSLWLVSMDPKRPFTFLDDRLISGDTLLGITSVEQLEYMHLDPKRGRVLREDAMFDWTSGVLALVADVAADRRELTEIDVWGPDPLAALNAKRAMLGDSKARMSELGLFADLLIGASLANAKRGVSGFDVAALESSRLIAESRQSKEVDLVDRRQRWLATDQGDSGFSRAPLHWPLEFPEVFEAGGFDAIIGNPPFLGGTKISAPLGAAYRDYLAEGIAEGVRAGGRCDLVAYFVLRAQSLLRAGGQLGLIATNSLAQGDTREVGLDQIVSKGATIRSAIKSARWPSRSAMLEYCVVWVTSLAPSRDAAISLDGIRVVGITSSLDVLSRAEGSPHRLFANKGVAHQGSKLDGMGFTMDADRAKALLASELRNSEVLFPFLVGDDINSRPDFSASRWVVNFYDWPKDRAATYVDCFAHVEALVRPGRQSHSEARAREYWWRYQRSRGELYAVMKSVDRVIALTRHTKTVTPVFIRTGQVLSDAIVVFGSDDAAMLAELSSELHFWWTATRGSSLGATIRYTPSDVFETFPLSRLTDEMRVLGDRLDTFRRDVMLHRRIGLTNLYNAVFDEGVRDGEIDELRQIHRQIDVATIRAYGWDDMVEQGLDHGFHQAGAYTRYTIGPAVRQEILDRLLELNHARYAEEVAAGLHDKKGKGSKRKPKPVSDDEVLF